MRPTSERTVGRDGQSGQGLAEYALVLALIAIVAIVSLAFLGGNIADMFWDPISEDFAEVLSNLGI
jgi:Flp pilus assembly pilin Flp